MARPWVLRNVFTRRAGTAAAPFQVFNFWLTNKLILILKIAVLEALCRVHNIAEAKSLGQRNFGLWQIFHRSHAFGLILKYLLNGVNKNGCLSLHGLFEIPKVPLKLYDLTALALLD